jgi:ankyrin repeat protein
MTILGNKEIVKQLVQAGAQLNVADELGNTALHRYISYS